MSSFRELPEHALQNLSDEDLIAYIRGAASTARPEAARTALAILVFGYIDIVRYRVRLKVGSRPNRWIPCPEAGDRRLTAPNEKTIRSGRAFVLSTFSVAGAGFRTRDLRVISPADV